MSTERIKKGRGRSALGSSGDVNRRLSERAIATKEEILETAAATFARNGFSSTSLETIAVELGFTKPALYYYFLSKEAILSALFDQMTARFAAAAKKLATRPLPAREKLQALVKQHVHLVLERPDWHTVYSNEFKHLSNEGKLKVKNARRTYDRIIQDAYDEGVRQNQFVDLDSYVVCASIIGMINSFPDWYKPLGRLDVDELADLCWRLINRGVCIESGQIPTDGETGNGSD